MEVDVGGIYDDEDDVGTCDDVEDDDEDKCDDEGTYVEDGDICCDEEEEQLEINCNEGGEDGGEYDELYCVFGKVVEGS